MSNKAKRVVVFNIVDDNKMCFLSVNLQLWQENFYDEGG